MTDKGEWLVHNAKVEGVETKSLIAAMAQRALDKLPIPKPMRWGNNKTNLFALYTATMLLGSELIEGELLGIKSARTVRGHRFMGLKQFELAHADHYLADLKEKAKSSLITKAIKH